MDFNLITNIETCYQYLKEVPLDLVYYSHIPTAIVAIAIGIFVLLKNKSLASKLLFSLAIIFSAWSFIDLFLWVSHDSRVYMFFWAIEFILEILLFVVSLYFVYAFINKKDVGQKIKLIWGLMIAPVVILTSTVYTLTNFDVAQCNPTEGPIWEKYIFPLELIFALWIIVFSILKYRKSQKEEKVQIIFLMLGICLFLGTFSLAGYIVNLTGFNYENELFGLMGLPVFLGFLAYLIVKFKAFDIKLIGAQALVVGLVILVGSQFFFAQNNTSIILTGVTLSLSLGFGYMLIRSVKLEIERKEQLQKMTDSLAQANDQLRKLDNAKTEFISIASHQLRTPVTAIKGFASLLLEGSYGEISAGVQGALEKMFISSERLVNLIEDLLNVSRIESGRLSFEFENASLEKILKELHENFLLIAKSKKFYLDLKLPKEPLPEFKMDAMKVRELVSNFIDNALKYTEKGGVTISAEIKESGAVIDDKGFVKASEKSPYGKVVRITVSDTGIGVPKEEIPFLFRKFSRGKDVSRLHVGGTGLGLFVGKAIADAHHGATWVESDGAGKGSRFIIEIPIDSQTS